MIRRFGSPLAADTKHRPRRAHHWTGGRGRERFRRLELLGLANGAVLVTTLTAVLLAAPQPALRLRLAVLGAVWLFAALALLMRRRFSVAFEAELQRCKLAEQKARAAELAKSRFLTSVSHEIRTPMSGVLGMTDLLLRGELKAEQREQVELIRTSAEALVALVGDVLDLSRIEAERLRLRAQDYRLRKLAGEVVRLLAPRATARQVDLRLHVDSQVPDALHGDPVRLRQVLLNLVSNAVRFTREGSVTVTVEPDREERHGGEREPHEPDEPALRFEVRDTGVGIRPADRARLFEPFLQAGSSGSGVRSGTGLGLVISKSIVDLMGGEIGFESTLGVGSSFWFRLPLVPARGTGEAAPAADLDAAEAARRRARHGRRILVVDDRSANRSVALALLHALGYAAEAVETGEDALALIAERSFDALLLDCDLPGLDGFETCRRLRRGEAGEGAPRLPVIAITAYARPEDAERCLDAGMDEVLIKPFRTARLATVLDRRLGIEPAETDPIGPVGPSGEPTGDELSARLALLERHGRATGESVVATFLHRGEADLSTLRRALSRQDGPALAGAAHSLAGGAGMLGATELAAKAADLATLARRGSLGGCAALVPALERVWRDTVERLER